MLLTLWHEQWNKLDFPDSHIRLHILTQPSP